MNNRKMSITVNVVKCDNSRNLNIQEVKERKMVAVIIVQAKKKNLIK